MKPEDELRPFFDAARQAPLPQPPGGFPERVLSAVARLPEPPTVMGQLALLFPRWSALAMLVFFLAVGVEFWTSEGDFSEVLTETTLLHPDAALTWSGL